MSKLPLGARISRIINYLRRSREDLEREKRTGEDTIAMQKQVMDRLLDEYGLPYDQVTEIGSGEKIETRPVFQQVLTDLQQEKYNCIAVKEISRLTRGDFKDYGTVYELIRQKRVYILTPYRLYDPKNANDLRQIRFEMFLSREEFETIRERMQAAKYSYALSGKFMGSRPAFGYRCNPQTQRLEVHDDEANLVRLIFQLYLHGLEGKELGFRAIATFLSRAGIPSPTGLPNWNPVAVKKILQNRVYLGEIRYSTTTELNKKREKKPASEWIVVKEAHEPIVSASVFMQAQRKSGGKAPATRFDYQTTELSGLIRCAGCGRRMVKQTARTSYRKKDGSLSTYEKEMLWCTTVGCTYVKYRAVEEMLLQFISRIEALPIEPAARFVAEQLAARERLAQQAEGREIEPLRRRRAETEERLDAIYRSYETGVYSEQEFAWRRAAAQREFEQLDQLLLQLEAENETKAPPVDPAELQTMLRSLEAAYHRLPTTADKNKLLRMLIETATLEVLQKGKGSKPARFRLQIAFRFFDLLPLRGDCLRQTTSASSLPVPAQPDCRRT